MILSIKKLLMTIVITDGSYMVDYWHNILISILVYYVRLALQFLWNDVSSVVNFHECGQWRNWTESYEGAWPNVVCIHV